MKILIITHYFPPVNSTASLRPYSWAKYWTKVGHDVTVLTTKKFPSDNLTMEMPYNGFQTIEVENRVRTFLDKIKTGSNKPNINGKRRPSRYLSSLKIISNRFLYFGGALLWDCRMPNIYMFGRNTALKKVRDSNWDVVVSTFAPFSNMDIAYKLKKNQNGNIWINDYRDLWTASHLFKGVFPFTIIEKYLEKKYNYHADVITTVSQPLAEKIMEENHKQKVHVIENGFDECDLDNLPNKNYFADKNIHIIHTGSIYKDKRDPSPLFKAMQLLKNEKPEIMDNLKVLFIGGLTANLDQLINKYSLKDNVVHMGLLPRKDALWMQRDADVLLFLEMKGDQSGILTGKLFEYLFSGTEIWAMGISKKSEAAKLIVQANAGIIFEDNVIKIKSKLIQLIRFNEKPKVNIKKDVIKKYTRKRLAEKMISLVNDSIQT
tara:strand:+ start:555 stop:1853 length:1299 start_codon:yes stop_codon:yes gene_type:complete